MKDNFSASVTCLVTPGASSMVSALALSTSVDVGSEVTVATKIPVHDSQRIFAIEYMVGG